MLAIKVRWISAFKMRLESPETDVATLMEIAGSLGERLQARMAGNFKKQRNFAGYLGANSGSYTAWKLKKGYSALRGHQQGRLQRAIEQVRSFRTRATSRNRVEIEWTDDFIRAEVPHAVYYTEAKVRRNRIMGMPKTWVRDAQSFVNSVRGSIKDPEPAKPKLKTPEPAKPKLKTPSIRTPRSAREGLRRTTSIRIPRSARGGR